MKKIGKLGLTLAMVLAMAVGTMATAFAADGDAEPTPTGGPTITVTDETKAIDKTYTAAEAGLLTENEFEYQLSYINAEQVGSNATAAPTGAPKTVTVGVSATDVTTKTGSMSFADLFDGIKFSAPGVYSFELKETPGTNPNIVYDNNVYTIKVQVTWADPVARTLKVESITIWQGTKKFDSATFENTPNTNVGTLNVTKLVKGNAANTNDEFTFTVKLTGVSGSYTAKIDGAAQTPASGDNTYKLKHGQTLVINNLPVGATYKVQEAGDLQDYTVTDNSGVTTDNLAEGAIVSGDNNSVTFTNTKNVPSITGVFMDVLPYALIVVVAAAACFFFMTRRRNREDY